MYTDITPNRKNNQHICPSKKQKKKRKSHACKPNQVSPVIRRKKSPFSYSCISNCCCSLKPCICQLRILWNKKSLSALATQKRI